MRTHVIGICYVIKSEQLYYPTDKKYIFVNEPVNCRTLIKTQMKNMFYWAGIISILICLPLRVSAQSYEQMWKQVEVLEHQPEARFRLLEHGLRRIRRRTAPAVFRHHEVAVREAPRVERLQQRHAAQQRRLAAARRPDDGHHLARLHLERAVLEHRRVAEALPRMFEQHDRLFVGHDVAPNHGSSSAASRRGSG